jgi:hypothetical protein
MKKKSSSRDILKVCPICLRNSLEKHLNPILGIIAPAVYICHYCDYNGPLYAEIELEEYNKINFDEFDYSIDDTE